MKFSELLTDMNEKKQNVLDSVTEEDQILEEKGVIVPAREPDYMDDVLAGISVDVGKVISFIEKAVNENLPDDYKLTINENKKENILNVDFENTLDNMDYNWIISFENTSDVLCMEIDNFTELLSDMIERENEMFHIDKDTILYALDTAFDEIQLDKIEKDVEILETDKLPEIEITDFDFTED